jgi:hypothetical protein
MEIKSNKKGNKTRSWILYNELLDCGTAVGGYPRNPIRSFEVFDCGILYDLIFNLSLATPESFKPIAWS